MICPSTLDATAGIWPRGLCPTDSSQLISPRWREGEMSALGKCPIIKWPHYRTASFEGVQMWSDRWDWVMFNLSLSWNVVHRTDGVMRTMSIEKLMKTLPIIQNQLDALLDFEVCKIRLFVNKPITVNCFPLTPFLSEFFNVTFI